MIIHLEVELTPEETIELIKAFGKYDNLRVREEP